MLRIAQREGGDSALAGYPVPGAKIGSRQIKIAAKREVGVERGASFLLLFLLQCCTCKVSYAAFTPAGESDCLF